MKNAAPLVALALVLALAPVACESKPETPSGGSAGSAGSGAAAADVPAKAPGLTALTIPADGKYPDVKVEGVTVPLVNIMDGGEVVLVDTDGVKPRSWEEQYKRKGDLPKGYFNLHKTNTNKNDSFDDDQVDKQGRWKMDEKGNIVRD